MNKYFWKVLVFLYIFFFCVFKWDFPQHKAVNSFDLVINYYWKVFHLRLSPTQGRKVFCFWFCGGPSISLTRFFIIRVSRPCTRFFFFASTGEPRLFPRHRGGSFEGWKVPLGWFPNARGERDFCTETFSFTTSPLSLLHTHWLGTWSS